MWDGQRVLGGEFNWYQCGNHFHYTTFWLLNREETAAKSWKCLSLSHTVKPLGKGSLGKGALRSVREGRVREGKIGWKNWVGRGGWERWEKEEKLIFFLKKFEIHRSWFQISIQTRYELFCQRTVQSKKFLWNQSLFFPLFRLWDRGRLSFFADAVRINIGRWIFIDG